MDINVKNNRNLKGKPIRKLNKKSNVDIFDENSKHSNETNLIEHNTPLWILNAAIEAESSFQVERKDLLRKIIDNRAAGISGYSQESHLEEGIVGEINEQWYACKYIQGPRDYMEDYFQIEVAPKLSDNLECTKDNIDQKNISQTINDDSNKVIECSKDSISFFAVYDGHGGDVVSYFCKEALFGIVREQETFPHYMEQALTSGFCIADKIICQVSRDLDGQLQDGSTATLAVINHLTRKLWVACAGDSRCILVRNDGHVVALSRDHTCSLSDESRRVKKLGGRIINSDGVKRVQVR